MTKKHAYQEPPDPALAESAWSRGWLTGLDVFRIAAWKSAKGLEWLTLNTESDFHQVTEDAMKVIDPWRKRFLINDDDDDLWKGWHDTAATAAGRNFAPKSGLMRLTGVSYPMATAILAVLDGERWPVIDRWAVQTVFGYSTFNWQRSIVYAAYCRHLATAGNAAWGPGMTIHELDQAAMHASMPDGELPENWIYAPAPPG